MPKARSSSEKGGTVERRVTDGDSAELSCKTWRKSRAAYSTARLFNFRRAQFFAAFAFRQRLHSSAFARHASRFLPKFFNPRKKCRLLFRHRKERPRARRSVTAQRSVTDGPSPAGWPQWAGPWPVRRRWVVWRPLTSADLRSIEQGPRPSFSFAPVLGESTLQSLTVESVVSTTALKSLVFYLNIIWEKRWACYNLCSSTSHLPRTIHLNHMRNSLNAVERRGWKWQSKGSGTFLVLLVLTLWVAARAIRLSHLAQSWSWPHTMT